MAELDLAAEVLREGIRDEALTLDDLVTALAVVYIANSAAATAVAAACDRVLDPSGRLLGLVREAARG